MVGLLYTRWYTGAAAQATSATPLPMWGLEGSSMVWYLFHVTSGLSNSPPSLPQSKQPSKGDTGNGFDKGLISGGSEAAIIWCGTVELKTRLEPQRFQRLLSYSMKRPENGGVRNHCLGTYSIYVAARLMLPCPPWFHHKGASSSLQPRSSRASQRQHWPQWYHRSW